MKHLILVVLFILGVNIANSQNNNNITIDNRTDVEDATLIAEIIAHEIIMFDDTLNVIIFPLPYNCRLEGAVVKNKCIPHTYTLLINESLSVKKLRLMMCHEFIHIDQYESGMLEIFGDIWIWGMDHEQWGSMTYTGYDTRLFEVDARKRQWNVNKILHTLIKSH